MVVVQAYQNAKAIPFHDGNSYNIAAEFARDAHPIRHCKPKRKDKRAKVFHPDEARLHGRAQFERVFTATWK
jgi:hypothetical protein